MWTACFRRIAGKRSSVAHGPPDDAAHVAEWRAQGEAIRAHYGAILRSQRPTASTSIV